MKQQVKQPEFTRRFPNRIESLELARLALLEFLEAHRVGQGAINRIEVVLEELMANVARHALGARTIAVEASLDREGLELSVEDDGEAFNPLDAADPEPYTSLETAKVGGQGIPLIKRLSKRVHYGRDERGNRITALFAVD